MKVKLLSRLFQTLILFSFQDERVWKECGSWHGPWTEFDRWKIILNKHSTNLTLILYRFRFVRLFLFPKLSKSRVISACCSTAPSSSWPTSPRTFRTVGAPTFLAQPPSGCQTTEHITCMIVVWCCVCVACEFYIELHLHQNHLYFKPITKKTKKKYSNHLSLYEWWWRRSSTSPMGVQEWQV